MEYSVVLENCLGSWPFTLPYKFLIQYVKFKKRLGLGGDEP